MKKIISLIITFAMMLSALPASADDVIYETGAKTIYIEGDVSQYHLPENGQITILMHSGANASDIKHLQQIKVNNSGSYSYHFKYSGNVEDCVINVKYNAASIVNSIKKVYYTEEEICSFPIRVEKQDGINTISCDLNSIYNGMKKISPITALYSNGALVRTVCKYDSGEGIVRENGRYVFKYTFDDENIDDIRVFYWSDVQKMLPVAKAGGSTMSVDFGGKMRDAELYGYHSFEGDTNWQRFNQAMDELPEEIPIANVFVPKSNVEYFVATDGDDANGTGTIEKPFKTLERAIDEIKSKSLSASHTVYLRGGEYYESGLTIDSAVADETNPLVIKAYNGEDVKISSHKSVTSEKIHFVDEENTSSETIARFADGMENKMCYIEYDDLGLGEKLEGFANGFPGRVPTLYEDNEKMMLSRYPNTGWDYIQEVIQTPAKGQDAPAVTAIFKPIDKTVFSWKHTSSLCIYNQVCVTWAVGNSVVAPDDSKQTLNGGTLTTNFLPFGVTLQNYFAIAPDIPQENSHSHFYYQNVLEIIDMPGEWCGDDGDRRIYFYPSDGVGQKYVLQYKDDFVFEISDTNNVLIENIYFNNIGSLAYVKNSSQVVFNNLNVKGSSASNMLVFINCRKSGLLNSEIFDVVNGTVISGDCYELTPHRNFVQNNHFSNSEKTPIKVQGVGNVVSHNLIRRSIGEGITVGGNENIVEYNEIRTAVLQGSEGCSVYLGGTLANQANHIRYNYIHDNNAPGVAKSKGGAIGFDDMSENNYMYGNVIVNQSAAGSAHSGDNNIFYGNLAVNCNSTFTNSANYTANEERFVSSVIGTNPFLTETYSKSFLSSPTWSVRYPGLKQRYRDYKKLAERYQNGEYEWTWTWNRLNGDDDFAFSRADTGCYYVENRCIDCNAKNKSISSRPAEWGKFFMVDDVDIVSNVDAEIKQYKGNDYNVVWNNTFEENAYSFDITQESVYNKAGLTEDVDYSVYDGESVKVILFNQSDNNVYATWMKHSGADYYYVEVLDNKGYINYSINTVDNNIQIENCSGKYIKITAYSLSKNRYMQPVGIASINEIL